MKVATIALALAVFASVCACSSRTPTIRTSSNAATVTTGQDNEGVTVQTKEGTMAIGESVDTSKLGAPVYPGAQQNQQGAISSTTAKGTSVLAGFKTADAFDKVAAFYKSNLPAGAEKMNMSSQNGSVATFQVGDENSADLLTVQVTANKPNETDILITHVTKTRP